MVFSPHLGSVMAWLAGASVRGLEVTQEAWVRTPAMTVPEREMAFDVKSTHEFVSVGDTSPREINS